MRLLVYHAYRQFFFDLSKVDYMYFFLIFRQDGSQPETQTDFRFLFHAAEKYRKIFSGGVRAKDENPYVFAGYQGSS